MIRVLFSYSHKDEGYRDELEIHLAPLKREGIISTWHDRRISAGDEFDHAIAEELEAADLILLLVSPYFLASDYCHEIEMRRALERHQAGDARVIPVILHPCDWQSSLFGKLLAVPQDGKPVSKHANLHDAYLDIVKSIRAVANAQTPATADSYPTPTGDSPEQTRSGPRSSNLRVPKVFSDHERDEFRQQTFEYMANYFENSLAELERRNPDLNQRFRRIDAYTFTATLYSDGNRVSGCRVMMGTAFGDFSYSHDENANPNSCNEWLGIEHDGYVPTLSPGGTPMRTTTPSALTQEGAAEYLWTMLLGPLQRG